MSKKFPDFQKAFIGWAEYMLVLAYILLDQWDVEKGQIIFVTFLELCDPAPALFFPEVHP